MEFRDKSYDLERDQSNYVLKLKTTVGQSENTSLYFDFFAYQSCIGEDGIVRTGSSMLFDCAGYFVRKGFGKFSSDVIIEVEDNSTGKTYEIDSQQLRKDALGNKSKYYDIKSFKFPKDIDISRLEELLYEVVNNFVFASSNLDFQSGTNEFAIETDFSSNSIIYCPTRDNPVEKDGIDNPSEITKFTSQMIDNAINHLKNKRGLNNSIKEDEGM